MKICVAEFRIAQLGIKHIRVQKSLCSNAPKRVVINRKVVIPRQWIDHKMPKNVYCCEDHFTPEEIIRTTSCLDEHGNSVPFPASRPMLMEDAVPTLFPNLEKYYQKRVENRPAPEEKRLKRTQEAELRAITAAKLYEERNRLVDYCAVRSILENYYMKRCISQKSPESEKYFAVIERMGDSMKQWTFDYDDKSHIVLFLISRDTVIHIERPLEFTGDLTAYGFLGDRDRGGLTYPSVMPISLAGSVYKVISALRSEFVLPCFLQADHHSYILETLSLENYFQKNPWLVEEKCETCECAMQILCKDMCTSISNTLLNAFVKERSGKEASERNMVQLKRDDKMCS